MNLHVFNITRLGRIFLILLLVFLSYDFLMIVCGRNTLFSHMFYYIFLFFVMVAPFILLIIIIYYLVFIKKRYYKRILFFFSFLILLFVMILFDVVNMLRLDTITNVSSYISSKINTENDIKKYFSIKEDFDKYVNMKVDLKKTKLKLNYVNFFDRRFDFLLEENSIPKLQVVVGYHKNKPMIDIYLYKSRGAAELVN